MYYYEIYRKTSEDYEDFKKNNKFHVKIHFKSQEQELNMLNKILTQFKVFKCM